MDDEEEVDIIGNYDDISNISSGQILTCDYTVHPHWVNENPENNFWSNSVPKSEDIESNVEVLESDEIVIEEPEPVPAIIDPDWTSREVLTSPTDLIFEDDIPATIEEVVINQEYSNNDESDNSNKISAYNDIHCTEYSTIKPEFETRLSAKNITFIGPTNKKSLLKAKIETAGNSTKKLKINSLKKYKTNNQKDGWKLQKLNKTLHKNSRSGSIALFKINNIQKKNKYEQNLVKKKRRKEIKLIDSHLTISHEAEEKKLNLETLTGPIIKVDKCDTESDIEIDIEGTSNDNNEILISPVSAITKKIDSKNKEENEKIGRSYEISNELKKQLKDVNIPLIELKLNPKEITELEKYVNYEFFDGRQTKTPEQYLRIRNHILSMWNSMKPNYVGKTLVRNGLRNGGDVNTISRIHRFLEQIGAINFGHAGEYFDYMRPIENFIKMYVKNTFIRNRTSNLNLNKKSNLSQNKINNIHTSERRQRNRSQRFSSTQSFDDGINYTISHMDGTIRPEPPRLNSDDGSVKRNYKHLKNEYDLVQCLKFSKENIAPFKISITLSTLLCVQLHSISSNQEVMGFLGGYCSKSVGRNKLSLTRYKPCRTSEQSYTMCEMCPVSQVEQSSSLKNEGYELLGWFHSHPSFPAKPSRTDIRTQKEMQLQFSFQNDKPFIGLILSCLNLSFKCIYVMPKDLHSNSSDDLPYEFDVDIIKDCTDFKHDVKDVLNILDANNCDNNEVIAKFINSSQELLSRFGYNIDTFYNSIF